MDVVRRADWVIDMGPDGGTRGGEGRLRRHAGRAREGQEVDHGEVPELTARASSNSTSGGASSSNVRRTQRLSEGHHPRSGWDLGRSVSPCRAKLTCSFLSVGLLAAGCGASATFTPTAPPPHALMQRPASAVAVLAYWDGTRPAVEIGILTATSSAHTPVVDERERVLRQLLKLAATTGCDAIFPGPSEPKTSMAHRAARRSSRIPSRRRAVSFTDSQPGVVCEGGVQRRDEGRAHARTRAPRAARSAAPPR